MEVIVIAVRQFADVRIGIVLGDLRADVLVGLLVESLTARYDRAVVRHGATRVLSLGNLPRWVIVRSRRYGAVRDVGSGFGPRKSVGNGEVVQVHRLVVVTTTNATDRNFHLVS